MQWQRNSRTYAVAAIFWTAFAPMGNAADALPDLSACEHLSVCIAMLDDVVPARDTGIVPPGTEVAAEQLSRFGESAKAELLNRVLGAHPGRRHYAGLILAHWPNWSEQDVPLLSAVLDLDHGNGVVWALAAVGSDRAIDALIADLPFAGAASQTGGALVKLAPHSLERLLPLLERDARDVGRAAALRVIAASGSNARPVVPSWTAIAIDRSQSPARRLAALRALGAAGSVASGAGPALRSLLTEEVLASEAKDTLTELGDPAVASEAVNACVTAERKYCLFELAQFRNSPEIIGPRLVQSANSGDGEEAAWAIGVIAQVEYSAAEPMLVEKLSSSDWRVAYAASSALGVFGQLSSIPALEKAARTHWLPEVRGQAQESLNAIRAGARLRPKTRWELVSNPVTTALVRGRAEQCAIWRWRGQDIRPPKEAVRSVRLETGTLIATDNGEWGGGLEWSPPSGPSQMLLNDNVRALERIEGGVLALAGLAHLTTNYGYVARVRSTATGWDIQQIARLPASPSAISTIGPRTYAAWVSERVVVFSEQGILGLAECRQ